MSKKSLGQEVSKLKSLLEVAAASTTALSTKSSKAKNALNDEEDEDMDVSFIREEVSAQKEIIISRDQVCWKTTLTYTSNCFHRYKSKLPQPEYEFYLFRRLKNYNEK